MSDEQPIVPEWWPEAGTAEEDEWATQALEIVRKVARRAAKNLGYHWGDVNYTDLESFLTLEALEFRARFDPPPLQDIRDAWPRILYSHLLEWSFYHYVKTNPGDRKSTMVYSSATALDSTQRPLARGDDGNGTVGDTGKPIFVSQRPVDPLGRVIEMEVMRDVLQRKGHRVISPKLSFEDLLWALDQIAPDPGAGQCAMWGCTRPPLWGHRDGGGLCGHHLHEANKERARPCTVDGCDKPIKNRGMCSSHYNKWRKANAPRCSEDECTAPVKARGLCWRHYDQAMANGTLERVYAPRGGDVEHGKPCGVDGCDRPRLARGMCGSHYDRWRVDHAEPCIVVDCDKPALSRGLCQVHYLRALDDEKPPCTVDGCEKPQRVKGLCMPHYRKANKPTDPCTVDGCTNVQFATGVCQRHYREQRKAAS